MARVFIGHKPGVGGVVKVMRNDTDDPLTTPNEHHGKFLFNSETTKIGYIEKIEKFSTAQAPGTPGEYFYPPGSNASNFVKLLDRFSNSMTWYYRPDREFGRPWLMVVEVQKVAALGVERNGPRSVYHSDDYGVRYLTTYTTYQAAHTRYQANGTPHPQAGRIGTFYNSPSDYPLNFSLNDVVNATVLDLPIDSSPLPTSSTGVPGSRNTIITPSVVRIAKGGVSEAGADKDDIIIDSERVPIKVARTGEVNIPAGPNTYVEVESPVPLTPDSYMDYMVWRTGQSITIPQSPFDNLTPSNMQDYRITYAVYSDRVRIYNKTNIPLTVRYVICFDDGEGSSGGSEVIRRLPSGDIQIKRPGSSDTDPKSRDILLDTRLSYLPIVAEGYITSGEMNESPSHNFLGTRAKTVTFANDGSFWPFVKYYVRRPTANGYAFSSPQYERILNPPPAYSTYSGRPARISATALVTDTSVKFHIAPDNPSSFSPDPVTGMPQANWGYPVQGLRYYIFGIPKNF